MFDAMQVRSKFIDIKQQNTWSLGKAASFMYMYIKFNVLFATVSSNFYLHNSIVARALPRLGLVQEMDYLICRFLNIFVE